MNRFLSSENIMFPVNFFEQVRIISIFLHDGKYQAIFGKSFRLYFACNFFAFHLIIIIFFHFGIYQFKINSQISYIASKNANFYE